MDKIYRTIQGDTWDMVSFKMYGTETHMDKLVKANNKYIHTVIFKANVELIIPAIDVSVTTLLPPWKRGSV